MIIRMIPGNVLIDLLDDDVIVKMDVMTVWIIHIEVIRDRLTEPDFFIKFFIQ